MKKILVNKHIIYLFKTKKEHNSSIIKAIKEDNLRYIYYQGELLPMIKAVFVDYNSNTTSYTKKLAFINEYKEYEYIIVFNQNWK